jgi:hypothetical protein
MLLASFVAGLFGLPGRQVRYANPQTLDQALKIALSVQETEKQQRFNESFYANFDDSLMLQSPSPTRHTSDKTRRSADAKRAVNHTQSQCYKTPSSEGKPNTPVNRNAQTQASFRCYVCEGVGHRQGVPYKTK